MPDIDEALTEYLLNKTNITALIERRLYFDELPSKTKYPAVVCMEPTPNIFDHTHDGIVSMESPNRQFTIYADSKGSAKAVAKQLRSVLSDFSGIMSGLEVQYVELINELSGIWKVPPDGKLEKNTIYQEYEINYVRSD